jgi:hypothetical protein
VRQAWINRTIVSGIAEISRMRDADRSMGVTPGAISFAAPPSRRLLDQRTATVLERAECLVARNDRAMLVVVPLTLRLRRFLDLVDVHIVHHPAIFADTAVFFAKKSLIGISAGASRSIVSGFVEPA